MLVVPLTVKFNESIVFGWGKVADEVSGRDFRRFVLERESEDEYKR